MMLPRNRLWLVTPILLSATACLYADSAEAPEDTAELEDSPAAMNEASDAMVTSRPDTRVEAPALAPGTLLTFVMEETVSTSRHGVGDEFRSTLVADAAAVDGTVILPAGTVGTWVVTESTSDNGEGEAVLAVRLQGIQTSAGWRTVDATVTESDLKVDERDSAQETAVKIGIGTAAGALLGRVIGDDSGDALKGAGVGAAMGTAVALATRNGSAELPMGSTVTVSLDQPVKAHVR